MRRIKSKGMKPELLVRSLVHKMGFRFRLHTKDLPGKPDLVFRSMRKVIFVDGCFWHRHDCREGRRIPKSNVEYWKQKISGNVTRDAASRRKLAADGWEVLTIWECQKEVEIAQQLIAFLACNHTPGKARVRAGVRPGQHS